MDRRSLLQLAAGAALVTAVPPSLAALAGGPSAPFVRSDVGRLRSVLVHSPSVDDYLVSRLSDELLPSLGTDMEAIVAQHRGLVRLLREQGVDVIELAAVLQSAIDEARRRGRFDAWLSAAYPRLSGDPDAVTAATLLGRDPARQFQRREDGSYRHFSSLTQSSLYTRDPSFMTPSGLVIGHASGGWRLPENMRLRFVMANAPELARYPIALDAVAEGITVEGGDAQLVDEKTLFLGVGQRTDPRAAPLLARRLGLDVLAVQIQGTEFLPRAPAARDAFRQFQVLFLHLDTFFTHVDHQHVLTVPWLLEQAHAGQDPLSHFIRGARAELAIDSDDAEKALTYLKEFGRVRLYAAGSGEPVDMKEMKLVDYVRQKGYKVTWVAGQAPDESADGFGRFMRHTLGELRRQAANVVATRPGAVISYAGSPRTRAALERDGVKVATFEARELWAQHGGPHCLTMPLWRE